MTRRPAPASSTLTSTTSAPCATGKVPRQQPYAVVLGCSDARVPVELLFNRAANELFVVRVAGNVLGQEQLGSIDYAVQHLGKSLKLLVVLGHSQCGAVTAAVDAFLKPSNYLAFSQDHHQRVIINSLFPAVRGAVTTLTHVWGPNCEQLPGYRAVLIETSVVLNAALTASILHQEFAKDPAEARGFPSASTTWARGASTCRWLVNPRMSRRSGCWSRRTTWPASPSCARMSARAPMSASGCTSRSRAPYGGVSSFFPSSTAAP